VLKLRQLFLFLFAFFYLFFNNSFVITAATNVLYAIKNKGSQTVIYKGKGNLKRVALTFDDGPDTFFTPQILDILKKEKVKATFFVVGQLVQKNPHVLRRIIKEGHIVGNHSWDHPNFLNISNKQIITQLENTSNLIYRITGKKPLLARPPYGNLDDRVIQIIQQSGYAIVKWSLDTLDWKGKDFEEIVSFISSNLGPSHIILQHSAGSPKLHGTVKALPEIIKIFKSNGYELVTLDKLLNIPVYDVVN